MENTEIKDFVQLFVDEEFFQRIVDESNRYHQQHIQTETKPWKDINVEEFKRFLGLIILMGQSVNEEIDYWSDDPMKDTEIFAKTMSKNRFNQIWNSLHFGSKEDQTSDKLGKILPIIKYFQQKFRNVYTPEQQLSVDEWIISLETFFFRVNYLTDDKRRFWVRVLCEARSGYICNFQIYSSCSPKRCSVDIISELVDPYKGLGYHLYMDKFHNSVANAKHLLEQKIRVCGTIEARQGAPKDILKLKPGETAFRSKNQILIQHFYHKRLIKMLTTIHSARMVDSGQIDPTTGEKIFMPACRVDYEKYMKGVEKANDYFEEFVFCKKSEWYIKVFFYLLHYALFNAYLMYKKTKPDDPLSYNSFLSSIIEEWIKKPGPEHSKKTLSVSFCCFFYFIIFLFH